MAAVGLFSASEVAKGPGGKAGIAVETSVEKPKTKIMFIRHFDRQQIFISTLQNIPLRIHRKPSQ